MVVTSGVDVWRGCGGVVVDGMRRLSRDSGGDGGGVVAVVDPSDEREEYTMMMMGVSLKFLAERVAVCQRDVSPASPLADAVSRRVDVRCVQFSNLLLAVLVTFAWFRVSDKTKKLSRMSFYIILL
ncbi:hypothetical protein Tco_0784957 [Tanacetum coccineum]